MTRNRVIDIVSWVFIAITMLMLKLASKYVENIVIGKQFVWTYCFFGLLIAFSWIFFLYKTNKNYFSGDEKRASAVLSQVFSIIILTIFIAAFYTHKTGKDKIYNKYVILIRKGNNIKAHTKYLFLLLGNRQERFVATVEEYNSLSTGDSVTITVGKGNTGYEYIYEFKKK